MEIFINERLIPYGIKLIVSLLVLFVGLAVIKKIMKILEKHFNRMRIDETLKPFILSLIRISLKVLLVLSVVAKLGVETSSFVAVLGAASFAIGLAFQGSLSNFAGGLLLLIIRPIKVGDFVDVKGHKGTVEAIDILNTTLITVDNKVIYIPNGDLSNSTIVNYSVKDTRRVDLVFEVGYDDDIDKVKRVLTDIVKSHPKVLRNPEAFIRLSGHGDNALEFTIRAWTKAEDYWDVYFDIIETVKKRFDREQISIPYPQIDVHMG